MTTLAGQMSNSAQPNGQWLNADGAPHYVLYDKQARRTPAGISEGNRQDYIRRVGWTGRRRGLGPLGWIILVPYDATGTYKVTLADDASESNLVTPVATTTTAAVAAGLSVIPVTSATGMAAGMPIAATGIPTGATIVSIAALNVTISATTTGTGVASGATVTVQPSQPPSVAKPPANTQ